MFMPVTFFVRANRTWYIAFKPLPATTGTKTATETAMKTATKTAMKTATNTACINEI